MMALAPAGGAEGLVVSVTTEERAARIAATRETASRALAYLIAQLEAAIAKAEAMTAERLALRQAGIQTLAESPAPQADGPAGDGPIAGFVRRRVQQLHTQFTRLQTIGKSLAQRFGRAINRILPFLGGILILANAESIAADFLSAMNDYADDIGNFEDETGSAAILSGECNNLAPGAGNIVLNYLLR